MTTTLRFLGTGGAFDYRMGNSAALVRHRGQTLLLDCGYSICATLAERHLTGAFAGILITHCHNDHVGSLPNLLLHRVHCAPAPPPTLYYPSEAFRDELLQLLTPQLRVPEKYFRFAPLAELPGVRALDTFGRHAAGMQSWSYAFEEDGDRLAYSGDLADPDYFFAWLADLPPAHRTVVLHDISFEDAADGHTFYKRLLPHRARFPELWGYHCDPANNPPANPIPLVANAPEWLISARGWE